MIVKGSQRLRWPAIAKSRELFIIPGVGSVISGWCLRVRATLGDREFSPNGQVVRNRERFVDRQIEFSEKVKNSRTSGRFVGISATEQDVIQHLCSLGVSRQVANCPLEVLILRFRGHVFRIGSKVANEDHVVFSAHVIADFVKDAGEDRILSMSFTGIGLHVYERESECLLGGKSFGSKPADEGFPADQIIGVFDGVQFVPIDFNSIRIEQKSKLSLVVGVSPDSWPEGDFIMSSCAVEDVEDHSHRLILSRRNPLNCENVELSSDRSQSVENGTILSFGSIVDLYIERPDAEVSRIARENVADRCRRVIGDGFVELVGVP